MAEEPTGQAPQFDPAAVIAALSPENAEFATRKAFIKDGADGKKTIDLNAGFESYRNAEKLITQHGQMIEAPDFSNDEKFGAWATKTLGVPAKPEDYKLERSAFPAGTEWDEQNNRPKMPEGMVWDGDMEQTLRVAAKKAGLAPAMYNKLASELIAAQIGRGVTVANQRAASRAEFDSTMQAEFGAGLEQTKQQANLALTFMAEQIKMDPGQLIDATARAMGDAPTVRLFAKIASMLGEDTLRGGKGAGFAPGPAAAKAELARLQGDSEHNKAVMDRAHPGHAAAVAAEERLNKVIYGP